MLLGVCFGCGFPLAYIFKACSVRKTGQERTAQDLVLLKPGMFTRGLRKEMTNLYPVSLVRSKISLSAVGSEKIQINYLHLNSIKEKENPSKNLGS